MSIIRYKCDCMQEEASFTVTAYSPLLDVAAWVTMVVQPAVTYHHMAACPNCEAETEGYIRLPLEAMPDGVDARRVVN